VNVKIEKKNIALLKQIVNISKGGYEILPLGNVYTCHGFFQKMHEFEKSDFKTFFHKLTESFVDREFGNLLKAKL
jgi:hypothetical protein